MAFVLWLRFKLPSCLFGNTGETSIMHEKAKFACFNYILKDFRNAPVIYSLSLPHG